MQALRAQSGTLALLGRALACFALLVARVSPVFGDAQCQALRAVYSLFCFYKVQEIITRRAGGAHLVARLGFGGRRRVTRRRHGVLVLARVVGRVRRCGRRGAHDAQVVWR